MHRRCVTHRTAPAEISRAALHLAGVLVEHHHGSYYNRYLPTFAGAMPNMTTRQEEFDPYRKWLGIPPKDRPPNHYRLLALELFEDDPDTISNAADRQMAHLRTFQAGPHSAMSQQLLNECSAARVCLLNKGEKAKYDGALRKQLTAGHSATNAVAAPPVPVPVLLAREYAAPVPIAQPASAVPVSFDDPISVRPLIRRKKSPHRSLIIPVACTLAAVLGLGFVFWQSQENQNTGSGHAALAKGKTDSGLSVASANKDAAPNVSPDDRRTDASTIGDEAMKGEEIDQDRNSLPSGPDDPPGDDGSASEMPMESAAGQEMADDPADEDTTEAMPSEEQEPASAGKNSPSKPKRATAAKKADKSRRPRFVPKDAILNNRHWYWFSANKATPEAAQLHALNMNGRLVTINSADENTFVAGQIKGPTLLGLLKVKGVWINSAGMAQGYFNWDRGQPSSARSEIYAAIHSNGIWHDYQRGSLFYCVEWGSEP